MIKTKFLIAILSVMMVFAPNSIMAQTGVDVESETKAEVGVKVGSETESGAESSTKAESETETEIKSESETKSSQESKQSSETKSQSSSETKGQTTVGNIDVTTSGKIKTSVGLPTKYPMPAVSAKNSVVLQTDQHLYKPGDRVSVEGSLWTELLASLSNENLVKIKVFDKQKNVIYEADSQITADGNYSTEFSLPNDAAKGAYTVTSSVQLAGEISDLIGVKGQTSIGASTKIAVVPPQVFKINVENHGDFDVKVASNSTVTDVKFNGDQKKVSVTVEGQSGTNGVTHISVPKSMVSGDMKVMIDGKAVANDKVVLTSNTEAETEVEVSYGHSIHTIDVIGTKAVPEFGTIAALILAVAIISIIVVTTKTRLSLIPRI